MANPISINEQALILSLEIGILTSLILLMMSFAIERIQSKEFKLSKFHPRNLHCSKSLIL